MTAREFDIVLYGATGFTGGLTADYLAAHAPTRTKWAVAGRNLARVDAVRDRILAEHPKAKVESVQADATDDQQLAELAARTRVLVTTVGPYQKHGEPVVRACAEAGTDYLDITGEPEFVDQMYVAHHKSATASGARLVHACGFDSIPHDLGAYFTVQQLAGEAPITEALNLRGVVRAAAGMSGGTLHSALGAFSRAKQMQSAAKARRAVEPKPQGRKVRAKAGKPHKDGELGYYLLPMPTIDPHIVVRSAAALDAFGPAFSYSHFAGTKTLRYAAGGAAGVSALGVAAQIPPLRKFLMDKLPAGAGPDESRREKSWFTVDFVGETGERSIRTRVSGGDPGYTETSKMLAESALCLAFDDNPECAGQVTTAQAMGDNLLTRLQDADMKFEVIE